jgi:hypothetical protein
MTKSQLKQFEMIRAYMQAGMIDAAARGLSAMIRAAMSTKSKTALWIAAADFGLTNHPEFIA